MFLKLPPPLGGGSQGEGKLFPSAFGLSSAVAPSPLEGEGTGEGGMPSCRFPLPWRERARVRGMLFPSVSSLSSALASSTTISVRVDSLSRSARPRRKPSPRGTTPPARGRPARGPPPAHAEKDPISCRTFYDGILPPPTAHCPCLLPSDLSALAAVRAPALPQPRSPPGLARRHQLASPVRSLLSPAAWKSVCLYALPGCIMIQRCAAGRSHACLPGSQETDECQKREFPAIWKTPDSSNS